MASLGFSRPTLESVGQPALNQPSNADASKAGNSIGSKQDALSKSSATTVQSNAAIPGTGSENTTKPSVSNPIALESRGYVIAKHQVLVSPQVSGRIMSLNIEEGRRVVKGDILAEVERTEYLADVE